MLIAFLIFVLVFLVLSFLAHVSALAISALLDRRDRKAQDERILNILRANRFLQ